MIFEYPQPAEGQNHKRLTVKEIVERFGVKKEGNADEVK
jgi:hypothetical protein